MYQNTHAVLVGKILNYYNHHFITDIQKRETELVVYHTDDVILCDRSQHMSIRSPPTGLQFEREIKVGYYCNTVCHYKGYTYVGLDDGAVDRIDDQGNVKSAFIKLGSHVLSIRAHNDQLFILMYGNPYKMFSYGLKGSVICTWDHHDSNNCVFGSKISIIKNQLAVADVTNKRITLYTPAGEVIRHIQCAEITAGTNVSICECDDNSVIISCYSTDKVFKFNLTSGAVEWTNTDIREPTTVRCYGQYVFVSGEFIANTRISVINSETGELYVLFVYNRLTNQSASSKTLTSHMRGRIRMYCVRNRLNGQSKPTQRI